MDNYSKKKWTVMVYLAGDNELNDEMMASLMRLHALRDNPGCNIFAYYATSNLPTEAVLYAFQGKKKDESLSSYAVKEIGGAASVRMGNAADRKTLVNFVIGCRKASPTKHNVLILSGHSDAFLGRSLLQDDTSMQVMKFPELIKALKEIADVLNGGLDILGFDSCAMGLLEIAYELRPYAKVMVTPQDFTPVSGWNYDEMLCTLTRRSPSTNPEYHARNFVDRYITCQRDFTVGGRSVEIAALRLDSDFDGLIKEIAKLADLLRRELPPVELPKEPLPGQEHCDFDSQDESVDPLYGDDDEESDHPSGLVYRRIIDLLLCSHWFAQTHMQEQTVDIKDFCLNLLIGCIKLLMDIRDIQGDGINNEEEDAKQEEQVDDATVLINKLLQIAIHCIVILNRASQIIIKSCYAGRQHQRSTGLSLFFPWSRLAYILSYQTYNQLAFIQGEGRSWLKLINRFTAETIKQDMRMNFEQIRILIESQSPPEFNELKETFDRLEKVGKYNPPSKGALARFRDVFGKVKNYPPCETKCE